MTVAALVAMGHAGARAGDNPLILASPTPLTPLAARDSAGSGEGLRIRLGYWFPYADFKFSKDGANSLGTRVDDDNDLAANYAFVFPTFELEFQAPPYGRVELSFADLLFEGDQFARSSISYGNITIPANESLESEFEFRTATLYGTIFIDLAEGLKGGLVVGTRYVHYFTKLESNTAFVEDDDTIDSLLPVLGISIEGFVLEKIWMFARLIWLDFTYGDGDVEVFHREWQVGVSLIIAPYFAITAEWLHLEIDIEDGGSEVRTDFRGPRIGAEVRF